MLSAVIHTTSDFLRFLNSREMRLGLKLRIKTVEPFDRTMVVSYGKRSLETLSHTACERLLVEKVK